MSEQAKIDLEELLRASDLLDRAEKIEDAMYRVHWGAVMVVVGVTEHALVAIAPMFHELPAGREAGFYCRLLQANSALGGVVSFALQPDGWIVLQSGRDLKGMDADEFALIVTTVARAAEELDNVLRDEFFPPPGEAAAEPASAGAPDSGE